MDKNEAFMDIIFLEQKKGFLKDDVGDKKFQELILLEKSRAKFREAVRSLPPKILDKMLSCEKGLPDYFMEIRIKEGIKEGLHHRYPVGWVEELPFQSENLFFTGLDKEFSMWSIFHQDFLIEDMANLPIFTFNCIGNYLLFLLAGLKEKYDLMLSTLFEEGMQIEELVAMMNSSDDSELLFLRFCAYKAYYQRLRLDQDLRKVLSSTANKMIIITSNRKENFWSIGMSEDNSKRFQSEFWRGENHLGKMLTKIRDFEDLNF